MTMKKYSFAILLLRGKIKLNKKIITYLKKNLFKILILLPVFTGALYCKTTSIIIPCHYKHAPHLKELLIAYEHQTILPNEIVISLSNANQAPEIINAINTTSWKFDVNLITHDNHLTAGQNRNSACKHARGDILILQDADDMPHPQRVEIIHYFFEKYNIDHLMHRWSKSQDDWLYFDSLEKIPYKQGNPNKISSYTNGAIALSKKLSTKVTWDSNTKRGEDVRFNSKAYKTIPKEKRIMLDVSLYQYRHSLSILSFYTQNKIYT